MSRLTRPSAEMPSQRGETWNDREAINRHGEMTPSQRVALAIEASRAALMFAEGKRPGDERDAIRSWADRCRPQRRPTRHGEVQVLNRTPAVPPYAELIAATVSVDFSDESAPICSLAHLRAMKLAFSRPRDLVDVAKLDDLNGP